MVNIHVFNTEIERVANSERDWPNRIMSTQWATQDVADSSALARSEIETHLVQTTAQLHFVRDVVVDIQKLSSAIRPIGHEQFDVQIVTLVQVVC